MPTRKVKSDPPRAADVKRADEVLDRMFIHVTLPKLTEPPEFEEAENEPVENGPAEGEEAPA